MPKEVFTELDISAAVTSSRPILVNSTLVQLQDSNRGLLLRVKRPAQRGAEIVREKCFFLIEPGRRFYLTNYARETETEMKQFTIKARKHLLSSRILSIEKGRGYSFSIKFEKQDKSEFQLLIDMTTEARVALTDGDFRVLSLRSSDKTRIGDVHWKADDFRRQPDCSEDLELFLDQNLNRNLVLTKLNEIVKSHRIRLKDHPDPVKKKTKRSKYVSSTRISTFSNFSFRSQDRRESLYC